MEPTKDVTVRLLIADVPNTSGRIFPEELLQELAVQLSGKSIFGHINNEDDPLGRVNLSKVTHTVEDIKYNHISKELVGTIKFLDTPYGAHAKVAWQHDTVAFAPVYVVEDDGSLKLLMVNMVSK